MPQEEEKPHIDKPEDKDLYEPIPDEHDPRFDPWNIYASEGDPNGSGRGPQGPKLTRRQFLERLFIGGGISYIIGMGMWNLHGFDKPLSELFKSKSPFEVTPAEKEVQFASMKTFLYQTIEIPKQLQLHQQLVKTAAHSSEFQSAKFGPLLISSLMFKETPPSMQRQPDILYIQAVTKENSKKLEFVQFYTNKNNQLISSNNTSPLALDDTTQIMEAIIQPFIRPSAKGVPWTNTPPEPLIGEKQNEPTPGTKFATFQGAESKFSMAISPQGEAYIAEVKN